ncbi:MAG: hypothetical protein ABI624_11020, partial [Casimicrobiaceae bacterium]
HGQREALAEEARRRGYEAYGDRLFAPQAAGPGAFQRGAGAFIAGAGMGGGSVGGTALGMAVGLARPGVALPLIAGRLAYGAITRGRDAYGAYVGNLQGAEPTGRTTGQSGSDLLDSAAAESRRYRTASLSELVAARSVLARGLGRTDFPDLPAVASVTGRNPMEEAASTVALNRIAPRTDPALSSRMLAEFGRSGAPTRLDATAREEIEVLRNALAHATDPARRTMLQEMIQQRNSSGRLPYTTALEGEFRTATLRVAGAQAGPLTRVPPEGIAAQVRTASQLSVPGIDMQGPQAIDVGAAIAAGVNAHVGRPLGGGGVMDDIRTSAVMKLRGTKVAADLKEKLDIDLDTIPGVMRAIERAPELAARGYPQIGRAMLRNERRAFGSNYELALRADGTEGETSHLLATRPIRSLIGARPVGTEDRLSSEADAISRSPEIDRVFEHAQHPELREYDLGRQIVDQVGVAVEKSMNDLKDSVSRVLGEAGTALTQGVLELLNRELHSSGEHQR